MNKELEALEKIKQYTMYPEDIEGCKLIETALKRLEQLEKENLELKTYIEHLQREIREFYE